MINVTNGKVLRLLVDDEPFDVRYGTLHHHERSSTSGPEHCGGRSNGSRRPARSCGSRRCGWCRSRSGRWRPSSTRWRPSATRPGSWSSRSWWPTSRCPCPTTIPGWRRPSRRRWSARTTAPGATAASPSCTARSTAACGWRRPWTTSSTGPTAPTCFSESGPDIGRVTVTAVLRPGQRLRILKLLAYGWSTSAPARRCGTRWRRPSPPPVTPVGTGLQAEQRRYLDTFWARTDVELDGDPQIEHAARFGLFHVLQASARAERRAIPAKGLTGTGYDGHAFWDTETFVLPALTSSRPEAARDALRWRHSTLPAARARAAALGHSRSRLPLADDRRRGVLRLLAGRARPPSTSTPTSPTPSSAISTPPRTTEFEANEGLELLVETARLWRSLGHHDGHGRFRLPGVTGPDEYSALGDDNVYTNLMAQQNLRAAADVARAPPGRGRPSRRRRGRGVGLAGGGRRHVHPLRRRPRRPPPGRAVHHLRGGTSRRPGPTSTRCSSTSPTSTSTADRW